MSEKILYQGAEAIITLNNSIITKKRISKSYRLKELDEKLRKLRTRGEARILEKMQGKVNCPKIFSSNETNKEISMEYISGEKLSEYLEEVEEKTREKICVEMGKIIQKVHQLNIIHGDLTTSNMIYSNEEIFLIDFGLSFQNGKIEDKAVDLHLLKQALEAKHFTNWEKLWEKVKKSYTQNNSEAKKVIERLAEVEKRGRYKD